MYVRVLASRPIFGFLIVWMPRGTHRQSHIYLIIRVVDALIPKLLGWYSLANKTALFPLKYVVFGFPWCLDNTFFCTVFNSPFGEFCSWHFNLTSIKVCIIGFCFPPISSLLFFVFLGCFFEIKSKQEGKNHPHQRNQPGHTPRRATPPSQSKQNRVHPRSFQLPCFLPCLTVSHHGS